MFISSLIASSAQDRHSILRKVLLLRCMMLTIAIFIFVICESLYDAQLATLPFVITVSAGFLSLFLSMGRLLKDLPVPELELFFQLLIDAGILISLILFLGGTTNPFIYYLLVLVAVAAIVLNVKLSWIFTVFTIIFYTGLLYLDLHQHMHHVFSDFQKHLVGMWINFVGSAILISLFISQLASTLRKREQLLANTREETLKNEQLVAIGTLAAATAHALGSPLSTITILLEQMRENKDEASCQNNLGILQDQIHRCKQTLDKLKLLASSSDQVPTPQKLITIKHELAEHYQINRPVKLPQLILDEKIENICINYSSLLFHSMVNIIDNGLDAAKNRVLIKITKEENIIVFSIEDDGDGVSDEVKQKWGHPFISSKQDGLGIGVFLANSTIEKLGGSVVLMTPRAGGTTVKIKIPIVSGFKYD